MMDALAIGKKGQYRNSIYSKLEEGFRSLPGECFIYNLLGGKTLSLKKKNEKRRKKKKKKIEKEDKNIFSQQKH